MKLVSCKCPNCHASINLNETLERGICNYCGSYVYNESALKKEKIEISGEVTIDSYNAPKKIDIAKKHYASGEYLESIKLLQDILKNNPFNYEGLKLILQYTLNGCSNIDIINNEDEIISYINKFKTVKKNKEDETLIEDYLEKLNDIRIENNIKNKNKNLGWILVLIIFPVIIFVIFLELINTEEPINYQIDIEKDVQKIKVGETISLNAKVYADYELVNQEVIWKPRDYSEEYGTLSENGELTANKVGRYYFCAHLASDETVSKCDGINIIASCESTYTFESKNKTYYDTYHEEMELTAGIDFCPGTYIVHIGDVQDNHYPYFIAVNSYSYVYEKNDFIHYQENGQDREFTFEEGYTLSVDYGVYNIKLIKK